ncbi:hypothetical protein A3749_01085 [Oleiphilus sp. HI0078]|uniref:hypothetical protein n=1 Tax=unclassified Oleiphilus TaxID=2631174 RepID=UPI0007C39AEA|nr:MULTISPECIES: hypothetical protein [unclassified Oleiphilus]KZY86352.1 hypothetical protein A3743_17160 [Oleiphilus sp. HI0072]KZZ11497.1 hypothetical protein A3749_01085 [Oleiphilus sp. HI0078]KZY33396.1 hypothetical protein A3729_06715 [Oleiphilus sp. HI0043]KZY53954.1 hypothetical protein A3735_00785 [Oleiphilus sp. HI0061]KZZ66317.1 hypothetical protein A3763_03150 [Oleiphilus sp. HI0128]
MALSSTSLSSIELVQPEIEATIQHAEQSLERFQENRDSGEDLQNCIDYLNQLRGIFVLVEVQGCVLLCQESVALANEVPVGANDDKNGLLTNLSNAIFILRRYTEYFCQKKLDHPELLLPIINELRIARKTKPFPESHFFDLPSDRAFDPSTIFGLSSSNKLGDFEHHAKRFRHMYQVGLLDILRDRNKQIALRLISRASKGAMKLCAGEPLAQFWALVNIVADTLLEQDMSTHDLRKRLFMKVEKYLREMALVGTVVTSKSAPESLHKELIYLLAISGYYSQQVNAVLEGYKVSLLDFDEKSLSAESKRLFGPGADVLKSLSNALQEELIQLKEKLDILERGDAPSDEDMQFIVGVFERLSSTLSMLDLKKISLACDQQIEAIKTWQGTGTDVAEQDLFAVADAVLGIEQAIKRFEETGIQGEVELQSAHKDGETPYLSEATIVVIDESKSGLGLAKRSISSYVESQGDKLHLATVYTVMDSIRGAMSIIGEERLTSLLLKCMSCIQQELVDGDTMPDQTLLETLADALTSLEYYIESMTKAQTQNDALLKLSEESLASIGYGT